MNKNPAGKTRTVDKPYATWTHPKVGWGYALLKSYQADNSKPQARWFVDVQGFGHDMGDEYVKNVIGGLLLASDLDFDKEVWKTRDEFIAWVWGSKA